MMRNNGKTMKSNKKTVTVMIVLLVVLALIVIAYFWADREELTEDAVEDVAEEDFNEVDTLDLVGPDNDLGDIEEDLNNLDEELEETSQLIDQLDTELENL